ncbi:hypothetical protein CRYPA_783 [uncultured Candidatus Thioglobus sp.]|uniref:hypothetical protein n=1 Tax=Bathymodiolus heckerae thiotrophic gill symbiont TaxID=1052212 RepID=UPI0010B92190|nr:hypothetical protein [Bathymodiolus heckerae thiotrophic gill symbiont]CAC9544738.1 hypothetical protein [uncultured Gammaproteobacteria bacterium]CAC9599953.1 hypothetical protein [uncultured Gammaproteobacteria bacterium]SHN89831.1 hypothetical protein BHECKSOX_2459 [Bathymodiolus heckerae thiotrophic gill symbiont]SMN16974.1 hypothetical protein CRYPA_783 [uncultured Candidatus Thioglobus sp.]
MKKLFLMVISILLFGCESENYQPIEKTQQSNNKIKSDLYYVPIGRDDDGCMMYQAKSESMMTMQAIIYQNGLGKFSMSRDKPNCL